MTSVKTLPDNEAINNDDEGYMDRTVTGTQTMLSVLVGDKIAGWSTNNLDTSVTVQ